MRLRQVPRGRPPLTTADVARARFYRKHLRENHRQPSILERIARAPSPFSVGGLVADFERFVAPSVATKKREQVRETARVRLAALRGQIP
ncbi:MAG: hypothetical protein ACYSUM_10380 [Planctomycetota bacterium]